MQPITKYLPVKKSNKILKTNRQQVNETKNLEEYESQNIKFTYKIIGPSDGSSSSGDSSSILDNPLAFCSQATSLESSFPKNSSSVNECKKHINSWGLPKSVVEWFKSKGIDELFDWQVDCLSLPNVSNGANLVFSAPTSSGKTMIADIIMIKQALKTKKKAIFILPFISVGREKVLNLKLMTQKVNLRVGAFMGATHDFGGISSVDIAVCTIEKANGLINRLIQSDELDIIGTIIVDELHMLGDSSRGYLLELLLSKVCYVCKIKDYNIQIVGMSATLPNLQDIANWIGAVLYTTDYRPVPFYERIKIDDKIYQGKDMQYIGKIPDIGLECKPPNDILCFILETVLEDNGVLVFCQSKAKCEDLAKKVAIFFNALKSERKDISHSLKEKVIRTLDKCNTSEILDQLERSPAALEPIFKHILPLSVAFHHAGLSQDERDIVEDGFRRGNLKVLIATSTLSSGVNLPARRVIVQSPIFFNQVMDIMTYKQMVGRAGRKGIDTEGESILLCNRKEEEAGKYLIQSELKEIRSCLGLINNENEPTESLKRCILEVIASKITENVEQIENYISCTFFSTISIVGKNIIENVVKYLKEFNFINEINGKLEATKLGEAALSTSVSPHEALIYVRELEKARKAFVLSNDLHILFEITLPTKLRSNIDWKNYFEIWNDLDDEAQHVARVIGIDPIYISNRGYNGAHIKESYENIHIRFYCALVLNDLVSEMPLKKISEKYKLSKGDIQQLQLHASTFAGIITIFCQKLGFDTLHLIIGQYRDRLEFGVQRELIDLMRLSCLTAPLAREFYKAGFFTVTSLATSKISVLESVLKNSLPFKLGQKNEMRKIWISGLCQSLHDKQIAEMVILEAREQVEKDIKAKINWDDDEELSVNTSSIDEDKRNVTTKMNEEASSNIMPLKKKRKKNLKICGQKLKSKNSLCNDEQIVESSLKESNLQKISNIEADDENSDSSISFITKKRNKSPSSNEQKNRLKMKRVDSLSTLKRKQFLSTLGFVIDTCEDEIKIQHIMEYFKEKKRISILFNCKFGQEKDNSGIVLFYNKTIKINQFNICFGDEKVFTIQEKSLLECFKNNFNLTLENLSNVSLIVFDLNTTYKIFRKFFGLDRERLSKIKWFDIKLAYWLNNPDVKEPYNCIDLVKKMPSLSINTNYNNVDSNIEFYYCSFQCFNIQKILENELSNKSLLDVFNQCEIPVVMIISEMELIGFGIDIGHLKNALNDWIFYKEELYKKACELSGEQSININSPKEIWKIMSIKLKLLSFLKIDREKSLKLTSNLRANKKILKKFSEFHLFPEIIIMLRKLEKIIDSAKCVIYFSAFVDEYDMGRVSGETSFYTTTGRISMENPNLLSLARNFMIKIEDEKKIINLRKSFIARKGYLLISADYSQLELRIVAHFSKDSLLLSALNSGRDVFICIAATFFDKDEDDVSEEERKKVKEICYGIMYGMGNEELADRLAIDKKEAASFKEEFFTLFKNLRKFIDSCKEKCRERKYATTLHKRRRYIPDIDSNDSNIRSKAERQSVNTFIQGSAADIIKFAMIKIDREIKKHNLDASLVLQIHDELIYEVAENIFSSFSSKLTKCMESCSKKLMVITPIKKKKGLDWSSLEEYSD